jgi:predicted nucleotidyltransferase component of viral defense system
MGAKYFYNKNLMNQIVANFDQILEFAKTYNIPLNNKRAIIREYLQVKILNYIYEQKVSKNIFFIGGTSLRLLRNLERFSEDLDFEYKNLSFSKIKILMQDLTKSLSQENILVELYQNITPKRFYFELRFKDLLFDLNITTNKEEKLVIKFDFEKSWKGLTSEIVLLNKYGFLIQINTLILNQILVQKIAAYLNRKQTMARDIYDIVWLLANQAELDLNFMSKNDIPKNIIQKVLKKYTSEKPKLRGFEKKLQPFLFNSKNSNKINLFSVLLLEKDK